VEVTQQIEIIRRGLIELITEEELKTRLAKEEPLRIKYGVDPSTPDIHLGHTVPLLKLREFQELGHKVILIIGDFTATIGDPSGRARTRPRLSKTEVLKNAQSYQEQIWKILYSEKTEVVFNSHWLEKMDFSEIANLASRYTVARLLERDDFGKRYKEKNPITLLEFLYPLIQGYDSVVVKADVEIGGSDQKFNLLVGRQLQREYGQLPQIVLTLPLLEGTDGNLKMSKSYGNYIGVTEPPREMFGKLMSIPDKLMVKYCQLLQPISPSEFTELETKLHQSEIHPKEAKMRLAQIITAFFHSPREAEQAKEEFERVFAQREIPREINEIRVEKKALSNNKLWIIKLLTLGGFCSSHSEARRLVSQGAVRIDNLVVNDTEREIELRDGLILKVGKRLWGKVKLT
jgi:tyrosyl-tRNA synthetase